MLVTPWVAKKQTKAELLAGPDFADVTVETQEFAAAQYSGSQDLATHLRDLTVTSKVRVEVATVVLQNRDGKYVRVDKQAVQAELKDLQDRASQQEMAAVQAKADYVGQCTSKGKVLKPRGATMKLNSKRKEQLSTETDAAWTARKAYWLAERALAQMQALLEAFLRTFHVFTAAWAPVPSRPSRRVLPGAEVARIPPSPGMQGIPRPLGHRVDLRGH